MLSHNDMAASECCVNALLAATVVIAWRHVSLAWQIRCQGCGLSYDFTGIKILCFLLFEIGYCLDLLKYLTVGRPIVV